MLIVLLFSLALTASAQPADDDWIDPYDMLNYDATTKTMRKPAETSNYPNVPTKRREYTEDSKELSSCSKDLEVLKKQNEDQQKKLLTLSQQPTCNPVFKRFLNRLLKEIERVGWSDDSTDTLYDAKVRVSKQTMTELKALLDGEESWRTGALDNIVSQILTDLRPHDYEAWVWHFEDSFGVELGTVLKILVSLLIIVAIICTELWSTVSWFVQFKRLFAVCFIISIVWNWFYLYKTAFAEHQNNLVKMDDVYQKCTGVKKFDWSDSLKEWFRSTWTLQDDPCKRYYEHLMVNPILLVPPTKAFSVTITTFFTEPLKHFGQGISEFLIALLKDLPVQLQIPVFLTIMFSFLVVVYVGVNAVFQHGITAPFRRRRRYPHDQLEPPQERYVPRIEGRRGGGDAPISAPPPRQQQQLGSGDGGGNQVRQRPVNRGREQRQKIQVQNLGNMDRTEADGDVREACSDSEQSPNQSSVESESEGNVSMEQSEVAAAPEKTKVTANKKPCDGGREASAKPNKTAEKTTARKEPPQQKEDRDPNVAELDGRPNLEPETIESVQHPVQETEPDVAQ